MPNGAYLSCMGQPASSSDDLAQWFVLASSSSPRAGLADQAAHEPTGLPGR